MTGQHRVFVPVCPGLHARGCDAVVSAWCTDLLPGATAVTRDALSYQSLICPHFGKCNSPDCSCLSDANQQCCPCPKCAPVLQMRLGLQQWSLSGCQP